MTNGQVHMHNGRSMAEIMNDFKEELKDFASTRIQMFRTEMQEKVGAWKAALPSMAIGGVLLVMAFVLLTAGLVGVIAIAFAGHVWSVAVACFIVMAIYALLGGLLLLYGIRTVKEPGLAPERTLKVLKQDQIWLQTEAKTQL